ncbi:MAG: DNA repair exonuclease [Candidatus Undinarchaeales archaeon]
MRVAVIGDMHLGYSSNTERSEDSFRQAEEAVDKALEEDADLILVTGDIFDDRVPSQEVLGRAMNIFRKTLSKKSEVKLNSLEGKNRKEISELVLKGTPVISLNGNHDRRGKEYTNPVQLLEDAGLLIHLHTASAVFEKNGEKTAVHGMSNVPEKYARTVLEKWNPKPVENAYNILMLHQNIGQYVYSEDEHAVINLEDLPKGFDLIIDGHVHWSDQMELRGDKFLLAGSTVSTQIRKIESKKPKRIWLIENENIRSKKLETARKQHYKEIKFKDLKPDEVKEKIENVLKGLSPEERKPLVRIVLKGTLEKGFETSDLTVGNLEKKYSDKVILRIGRQKLLSYGSVSKKELLKKMRKKQMPVEELGLETLKKHLKDLNYKETDKTEKLLKMFIEKDADEVYKNLTNE